MSVGEGESVFQAGGYGVALGDDGIVVQGGLALARR